MTKSELKNERIKFEFTQSDMADLLGITLSGYQKYEYGERDIPKFVPIIIKQHNLLSEIRESNKESVDDNKLKQAVNYILENIDAAEKLPQFSYYKKSLIQEGMLKSK